MIKEKLQALKSAADSLHIKELRVKIQVSEKEWDEIYDMMRRGEDLEGNKEWKMDLEIEHNRDLDLKTTKI